ncbi:MAG: EcsC family protein [Clostridia bacterium]|nr:EcsC family protein [Clostridia bacterium]
MSENISFEMVLKTATGLPMVKIDRESFLQTALTKHFDQETIKKAIDENPASAGISVEKINEIAKNSINYETTKVTALSAAAGIPGGFAMLGTVPADLAQYFGHMLRILQKLVYLYGWQELFDENGNMDDETANLLTLFTGVMFGVSGATSAVTRIAEKAAEHTAKNLAKKALTKGAIYPIVKKVAGLLGVKMTKQIFARGVSKIIPVLGGAVSGALTLATYKPMAEKLRKYLEGLKLADVEFYKNHHTKSSEEYVEVEEYEEVN